MTDDATNQNERRPDWLVIDGLANNRTNNKASREKFEGAQGPLEVSQRIDFSPINFRLYKPPEYEKIIEKNIWPQLTKLLHIAALTSVM